MIRRVFRVVSAMLAGKEILTPKASAFATLELATASAALVILLGLAVSLARFVRAENGFATFRGQLAGLSERLHAKGIPDNVPLFAERLTAADEARHNDRVRDSAFRNMIAWTTAAGIPSADASDVWGLPVVLIDDVRPELGMAPHGRAFLMSPGPDGRYFTLIDNVYDYDIDVPTTQPTAGGHRE